MNEITMQDISELDVAVLGDGSLSMLSPELREKLNEFTKETGHRIVVVDGRLSDRSTAEHQRLHALESEKGCVIVVGAGFGVEIPNWNITDNPILIGPLTALPEPRKPNASAFKELRSHGNFKMAQKHKSMRTKSRR